MIFSYVLDKLSCFKASQNDFSYVQSGTKCGVGSHRTCSHFLAHGADFNNFRQKIPVFDASRQKRVLFNCFATKQCLGMLKM